MDYNGLQLVHMSYEEAYDFAGEYGMNAILVDLKDERHPMFMCRLKQYNGKLMIGNTDYAYLNANTIEKSDFDIYWIGLR